MSSFHKNLAFHTPWAIREGERAGQSERVSLSLQGCGGLQVIGHQCSCAGCEWRRAKKEKETLSDPEGGGEDQSEMPGIGREFLVAFASPRANRVGRTKQEV